MPCCYRAAIHRIICVGDNRFVTFTRDFVNSGKPVFAICHGPQLLISADVIRGAQTDRS
ncbi:putative general stress protein [Escherichia coli]|uniref:Putative general stress protein n=1 Tax=Escherichia coli TaxID=562 RepID=A0A376Y2P0_ECOLX|nr:putative general stress protein [Escherichia coli]